MLDQNKFMERLAELAEYAELNGNVLTKTEVEESFAGMELAEAQFDLIYRYLFEKKIRIQGIALDLQESATDSADSADGKPEDYDASGEDSKYLAMYMEELAELPAVSEPERLAMAIRRLAGEEAVYAELLNAMLPDVVEAAKTYCGRGVLLEDLIQEGNIGLMQVLQELTGKGRQEEPLEYIREYVKFSIAQYIDGETETEDAQERVIAKLGLLHEASKYMAQENGVLPSKAELAEYTRIPQEEIEELIRLAKDINFLGEDIVK